MIKLLKSRPEKLAKRAAKPKFFQNPEFYLALREKVIPALKTYPSLRIWNIGCKDREELYSLAILICEEGLGANCRIYVTDSNGEALQSAEEGEFLLTQVKTSQKNYKKSGGKLDSLLSFFVQNKAVALANEELKSLFSFFQHQLDAESSLNEFHVVVCQEDLDLKDAEKLGRIQNVVLESLCLLGVLALRDGESIADRGHYRSLDAGTNLFKRIA